MAQRENGVIRPSRRDRTTDGSLRFLDRLVVPETRRPAADVDAMAADPPAGRSSGGSDSRCACSLPG